VTVGAGKAGGRVGCALKKQVSPKKVRRRSGLKIAGRGGWREKDKKMSDKPGVERAIAGERNKKRSKQSDTKGKSLEWPSHGSGENWGGTGEGCENPMVKNLG